VEAVEKLALSLEKSVNLLLEPALENRAEPLPEKEWGLGLERGAKEPLPVKRWLLQEAR
jgi:hypothetical protein